MDDFTRRVIARSIPYFMSIKKDVLGVLGIAPMSGHHTRGEVWTDVKALVRKLLHNKVGKVVPGRGVVGETYKECVDVMQKGCDELSEGIYWERFLKKSAGLDNEGAMDVDNELVGFSDDSSEDEVDN